MSQERARWLAAGLVLLGALMVAWTPIWSRDWGWHLATVERLLAEGQIPRDDVFSYTSDRGYEAVHLVFQLLIYALVKLFGAAAGLGAYKLLAAGALGVVLHGALIRRGLGPWAAAALSLLVVSASEYRLMVRPHMFTTLGLVLLLDALLLARDQRLRHPVRLVPLFLVWANAHPGVVFGVATALGFVGAEGLWAWLGRRGAMAWADWRRLTGWALAGGVATLLGPLGPGLYPYLLRHRGMQAGFDVVDIRPLYHLPMDYDWAKAGALVLLGLALALRHRRRLDPTLGLASLAFLGLGVQLARELPLAMILVAFLLAPVLAGPARRLTPPLSGVVLALALTPWLLMVARLARHELPGFRLRPGSYPVEATRWIQEHRPRGPLYNTHGIGGYLVWKLAPRRADGPGWKVYSDGRTPMFLGALELARDFAAVEARYAPQVLVVDWSPGSPTAAHSCEAVPGFAQRYALVHVSRGAKVYLRRDGANEDLVQRFGYRHLTYWNRMWPGRVWEGVTFPAAGDPEALAAEVARAREEAPGLPFLPD